jgi:hypothetical protein
MIVGDLVLMKYLELLSKVMLHFKGLIKNFTNCILF